LKDILTYCTHLAYLDVTDVSRLEQDLNDMIVLADRLIELEILDSDLSATVSVEHLRNDMANSYQKVDMLFDNASNICDGGLCVPRVTGV